MKKTLIFTDQREKKAFSDAWNLLKEKIQAVIDAYNATGLPALTGDELQSLFVNTEHSLYDKMSGGQQAHLTIGTSADRGHMAIDKSKAIEMLTKPAWWAGMIAIVKSTVDVLKVGIRTATNFGIDTAPATISKNFVIDGKGKLQFSEKVVADILDAGNHYVSSEYGNKIISFIKSVVKAYYDNEIDKLQKVYPATIGQLMEDVISTFDNENKTFIARKEFVRTDKQLLSLE